jgi:hypothetical protein
MVEAREREQKEQQEEWAAQQKKQPQGLASSSKRRLEDTKDAKQPIQENDQFIALLVLRTIKTKDLLDLIGALCHIKSQPEHKQQLMKLASDANTVKSYIDSGFPATLSKEAHATMIRLIAGIEELPQINSKPIKSFLDLVHEQEQAPSSSQQGAKPRDTSSPLSSLISLEELAPSEPKRRPPAKRRRGEQKRPERKPSPEPEEKTIPNVYRKAYEKSGTHLEYLEWVQQNYGIMQK